MEKIEDFVRTETEIAREKMNKTVKARLQEVLDDVNKKMNSIRSELSGQFSEAVSSMNQVKDEQDAIMDKMKKTQTEILIVNRTMASQFKKMKENQL